MLIMFVFDKIYLTTVVILPILHGTCKKLI